METKHAITVPGRYDQIRHIVAFVAEGAAQAGLDEDARFHVELCCDEACTNVIEHAYGGEDVGTITVSYEILPDAMKITIQDNGRSFDPKKVPPPPDFQPAVTDLENSPPIGGLGVHFMRKLMDEVHFSFDAGGENTLIMVKKRKEGAS